MNRDAHGVEVRVITMRQNKFLQMRKLTFDPIEPRGVRRQKLKADIVRPGPLQDLRRLVGRPVVENDPQPPGVLAANRPEKTQELPGTFALFEMPPELARPHVVSRQQVAHAVGASIGGAKPLRLLPLAPRLPGVRSQLQRPELVDTNHLFAPLFRRLVKGFNAVFFTSKSGSFDCFHVFVRWSEK